jgi:L-fuculose-phosphate aldolase
MANEAQIRRDLVRYSQQMHDQGWVSNHDGNLSALLSDSIDPTDCRIACTPTAWSKKEVKVEDLLIVDHLGQKKSGSNKPFSEINLHLAVYRLRADVKAVVHAHCPYATAFACAQKSIPHPFLPEAVVSIGASIPMVPLALPGQSAVDALSTWIRKTDVAVIAGNGVLAWGPDLNTAYLRMELVEHIAKIAYLAQNLGGVKLLEEKQIESLIQKRVQAKLNAPEELTHLQKNPNSMKDPVLEKIVSGLKSAFPNQSAQAIEKMAQESLKQQKKS